MPHDMSAWSKVNVETENYFENKGVGIMLLIRKAFSTPNLFLLERSSFVVLKDNITDL